MKIQVDPELTPGKRLSRIRKNNGYTQNDLAKYLKVSRTTVADYEQGRTRLNDQVLIKLALLFEISIDELLGLKINILFEKDESLRIMKRLKKIEKLSVAKQKILLHTIDSYLRGEGV